MEFATIYSIENCDKRNKELEISLEIFDEIYEYLNLSPEDVENWIASGGLRSNKPIVQKYPQISRILFMYVDSVVLSGRDLMILANECRESTTKSGVGLVSDIAKIAENAYLAGKSLEFSHP